MTSLILSLAASERALESLSLAVAQADYETAGEMLRSADDTTCYQQLESLIKNLQKNGWL